ncbi:MAG: LON peptidase substrate-binding domain-containing protein [Candidatus Acidiferrales bacterium]
MRHTRIPLFPLDVVLLPGSSLPLHIFEPRYKKMIGRCLAEKIEFGMIYATGKNVASVGCTAEIVLKMKDYPDGRMDILTRGRAAFRLLQLLQDADYHEGVVEYLSEELCPDDAQKNARITRLLQECHILLYGQAWIDSEEECEFSLAYRMAARLPMDLEQKQWLLEMRAENERCDFLEKWLGEFLPKLEHRQSARKRAAGNGHGPN